MADFYHVTFAFRRADFYNEIPSRQPDGESFTSAFRVARIFVLFAYFFLLCSFFMREKIMWRAKSVTTYCFSASCFFVGPQRPSSHRRPPRHRHDAASNISWRSSSPAGTNCRSYVFIFNCLRELINLVTSHLFYLSRSLNAFIICKIISIKISIK